MFTVGLFVVPVQVVEAANVKSPATVIVPAAGVFTPPPDKVKFP
jgi:hypothetical protein